MSIDGGAVASYSYDGMHRRVKKTIGGSGRKFIPAGNGFVLSEYDLNGVWKGDLIYFNGRPLATLTSGSIDSVLYFVNDHLGSPVALVDNAKQIRWSAKWYPFGGVYDEQVSTTNFLRFPGQWEDDEHELSYNWHRYYSPKEGRYYQADPIGLNGGVNLFGYVSGNPLRRVDYNGLEQFTIDLDVWIPYDRVGPYLGDNRGPSLDPNRSSRIRHHLTVETDPTVSESVIVGEPVKETGLTFMNNPLFPHGPYYLIGHASTAGLTETASRSENNCGDNAIVDIKGSASNPLFPFAPAIDYTFNLVLTPGREPVVHGAHDGFPAYRLVVRNEAGATVYDYIFTPHGWLQTFFLLGEQDIKVGGN